MDDGIKYSMANIDATINLSDNEIKIREEILNRLNDDKLMAQINDTMSIVEVREKLLRKVKR